MRCVALRNVALAMVDLQGQGFTTSEGSFTTLSDLTYSMPDERAYCGYHQQDRDSAIRTGILYISYGPVEGPFRSGRESDKQRAIAARTVVSALEAQKLSVIWDGEVNVRIRVDLDV